MKGKRPSVKGDLVAHGLCLGVLVLYIEHTITAVCLWQLLEEIVVCRVLVSCLFYLCIPCTTESVGGEASDSTFKTGLIHRNRTASTMK